MIRFHNFDLLHHFSGLCIVLLLLVGYLIIGIFALAWLLVKCLHECFKLISALLEWDMDHIIGLSTEMNLNWINIPLSIAFSLNVLHLKNMGFSFLRIWHSWANLLRVIRIKVAFTSSLPDFPWGSCYSNDPPHPSPPPPIINQFSMVRPLYSVIDYLYPLHSPSWKPSDPLKILQNPPPYPGDKNYDGSLWTNDLTVLSYWCKLSYWKPVFSLVLAIEC